MSHPRGIVPLPGTEHSLRYTFDALCALEEEVGNVVELLDRFTSGQRPSMREIRSILKAGLLHENPKISDTDVGAIVDTIGLQAVSVLIGQALQAAFGAAEEGAAKK